MADNAIRKQTDAVLKNERSLFKVREELKSKCTHTLHGEPSFVPSNEPRQEGQLKYICKQCQKPIFITAINEDDLQKACNLIDQSIDIIKITAGSINNEDDAEILSKLAKMQYRVRNDLMPTYKAAVKKGNRNNKRGGGNNNHGNESSWARPQIAGR